MCGIYSMRCLIVLNSTSFLPYPHTQQVYSTRQLFRSSPFFQVQTSVPPPTDAWASMTPVSHLRTTDKGPSIHLEHVNHKPPFLHPPHPPTHAYKPLSKHRPSPTHLTRHIHTTPKPTGHRPRVQQPREIRALLQAPRAADLLVGGVPNRAGGAGTEVWWGCVGSEVGLRACVCLCLCVCVPV